jgi:hypothetical protein
VVAEVVIRAVRLAQRLTEPLKIYHGAGDAGGRTFTVDHWKFEVKRHTAVYYGGGRRYGDPTQVQIWDGRPGVQRVLVFVFDKDNPPYQNSERKPWSMHLPTCRDDLLPHLRRSMVLDDLAECG